jgi:integrase
MTWLDEQMDAEDRLSDGSIRHNLNLVSRVFAFGIGRNLVPGSVNPARQIPTGKRPSGRIKKDMPWINDDATVRALVHGLPEPINLMFYIGNQSGLRTGEVCGLRLSDLDHLDDDHAIRVRFSYAGPLKEDKHGEGKTKYAPAPADARDVLGPWLERRKAEGAGPEDLLFVTPKSDRWPGGAMYSKAVIEDAWNAATGRKLDEDGGKAKPKAEGKTGPQAKDRPAPLVKVDKRLTWYAGTRHSFVSRSLSRGASLDVVSSAVGHSSPEVTKKYYDHLVRKTFAPESPLTQGLGLGAKGKGKVLPIRTSQQARSKKVS